jgi:quinoprotein glucose dehydrogenase
MTSPSSVERAQQQLRPPRIYPVLLLLLGLPMVGGGLMLITLDGSPYYVIAGVFVIAAAVLLWRGRRAGAWLYGAFLIGTLAWSVWEVGLDVWGLLPRLLLPTLLGAWLLMPRVRRCLV